MVEGNGASRSLFTQGYKYIFAVLSTTNFYLSEAINLAAEQAVKQGRDPRKIKVALAMENDPFSQDVRLGLLDNILERGMKIVIDDKLPPDLSDMSATLNKVRALKPDILLVSGHSKGAALVTRQLAEMRVKVPMLAITHCESAKVTDTEMFGNNAEGTLCAAQWAPSMSYEDKWFGTAGDYTATFEDEYGYVPPYQAAESTAAVLVFVDAIQRAQSFDPDKVRAALVTTDLNTFYGDIRFGSEGNNIAKPMILRQIQNGKYVPVAPAQFVTGEVIFPRPGS